MGLSALLNHWALRKASPSRKILPQESIAQGLPSHSELSGDLYKFFSPSMAEPQLWVREEGKGEYLPVRLCSSLSVSP